MFMVEIDGMRLLYTGDYSRAADRHMPAADLPSPKPHIGVLFSVLDNIPMIHRAGACIPFLNQHFSEMSLKAP